MKLTKLEDICRALRSIHSGLEEKGDPKSTYALSVGVVFPPSNQLPAETVIDSVTKNKTFGVDITYNIQASVVNQNLSADLEQAKTAIRKIEQELAKFPKDISGSLVMELQVNNELQNTIMMAAQENYNKVAALSKSESMSELTKS